MGASEAPTPSDPQKKRSQAIQGEVAMGRGFVSSYRNLLSAHSILFSLLATANFIGFLQPPKGWVDEATAGGDMAVARAKSVMYKTSSLEAFSITNSLSLYCSVSGLLYYIYCTNVSVLSMTAVEGLTERNYYDDPREPNYILTNMRAYLRSVGARPSSRGFSPRPLSCLSWPSSRPATRPRHPTSACTTSSFPASRAAVWCSPSSRSST